MFAGILQRQHRCVACPSTSWRLSILIFHPRRIQSRDCRGPSFSKALHTRFSLNTAGNWRNQHRRCICVHSSYVEYRLHNSVSFRPSITKALRLNSLIRPIIGGVLSQPAERWPDTFGRIHFFRRYPYFLPCAAAAFLAFLSYPIAFFGLNEVRFCTSQGMQTLYSRF